MKEQLLIQQVANRFKLDIHAFQAVEDSHSSTVYQCTCSNGEIVFIKIPFSALKFQRELEAYHILKNQIPIPTLLDSFPEDEHCPGAFLLSALKGQPLRQDATPAVAFRVGEVHAQLHRIKPDSTGEFQALQNVYPTWGDFVERQFYSFAEDVKLVLDPSIFEQSIEKFEQMRQQLPPPDGPSFIHMDFRPGNIIVGGTQLTGIIDFESVRFGATEMDFTKIYRDFLSMDHKLYEAYQNGYNSIRPLIDLEAVLPFYQFTDAFNSIGWCQRRGVKQNAVFLQQNLEILRESLSSFGKGAK